MGKEAPCSSPSTNETKSLLWKAHHLVQYFLSETMLLYEEHEHGIPPLEHLHHYNGHDSLFQAAE